MEALIRFNHNFAVTESLLAIFDLFHDLQADKLSDKLHLAICEYLGQPNHAAFHPARNDRVLLVARAAAPIPQALLLPGGLDSLLRQAVVASSTALESFYWNALVENIMTVIKAKKVKADETIRNLTMTLGDYMSIQEYQDPDVRVEQIIQRNFERGTLYDVAAIDKITGALTIKDYWKKVEGTCGQGAGTIKTTISELVKRRNQIVHRGDLPDRGDPVDPYGLRPINPSWVIPRVQAARTLANATATIIAATQESLKGEIRAAEEQAAAIRMAKERAMAEKVAAPKVEPPAIVQEQPKT
jgi:hypothetical protein